MTAIGAGVVFLLMFSGGFLAGPPRDLASLVEPTRMLEQMQVRTDEASLIALLEARHGERPVPDELPGPAGDMEYVKHLLGIRALEGVKSQAAVAVLEQIAGEDDITLKDAATQALAVIGGRQIVRPSGVLALKRSAEMVPPDAGFVFVLDAERGSKTVTVRDYFALAEQTLGPAMAMLGRRDGGPEQIIKEVEEGIVLALSLAGNVRLDSAAVVLSDDIGPEEDTPYICIILKGLYDPGRIAALCTAGIGEPLQIEGRTVFREGDDPAVCLVDEHTALISFGPGWGPRHVERVLQGMDARQDTPLPAHAARAFDLIVEGQARLAGSGALTDAQKAMIEEELAEELARLEERPEQGQGAQMELAALRIALGCAKVDLFEGYATMGSKLTLRAACEDANVAAVLHDSLTRLEEGLRNQLANVPEPFKPLFKDVTEGARLWEVDLNDTKVVVRVDSSMLTMLAMTVGRVRRGTMPDVEATPMEPEMEEMVPIAPEPR